MNPLEQLQAGDLDGALESARKTVQSNPSSAAARVVLADVMCFHGDFERADQQLDNASTIQPDLSMTVVQLRRVVRAEVARHDFHRLGRVPEMLQTPDEEHKHRLRAALLLREKQFAEAAQELASAESLRTRPTGTCNGNRFGEWRDGDDLLAGILEVLSPDGRYFWVPFSAIEKLQFAPPQVPRDLLFRQTTLTTRSGVTSQVYVPVLYYLADHDPTPEQRRGRTTDWIESEGHPVRGVGQRVFLTDEQDYAILEVQTVQFDPPAEKSTNG